MPKVGDGTGMGSMPPTEEGLSHFDGDEAPKLGAPFSDKGGGHAKHDGPQRTSHPHGGGETGKKD